MDLLEQMREQGLTPDTMSYNAAIAACARSSKVDEALALLKEALGRKVADVVTYNSAMQVSTGMADHWSIDGEWGGGGVSVLLLV